MPDKRKAVFANGETYHIFNRSIASENILVSKIELRRALDLVDYYRFRQRISYSKFRAFTLEARAQYLSGIKNQLPLVEIYAFAFMPDHFHLLLKQIQKRGIISFTSNFQNGFAKYYNKRHDRDGSLFRRPFKAKWINLDEKLLHVSRYIHLNPVTSYIVEYRELASYPWTSYSYYTGNKEGDLVNTEFIIHMFGSSKKYEDFVSNQVDYQRKLHRIKNFLLE